MQISKAKPHTRAAFVMLLIYSGYNIFFILQINTFDNAKTIKFSLLLSLYCIKGYIQIPPRAIKVNSIPSMVVLNIIALITVDNKTRDILAAAECSEKMRKVVANAFF